MIRRFLLPCALALAAVPAADAQAQSVEGTYVFPQKVMTSHDSPPIDSEAKLILTVKGDSVFGTWSVVVPGREPKPSRLRGTLKGNTITLVSDMQQAQLRGADDGSDVKTIDVYQEFVLTLDGDAVSGQIIPHSTDENVEMPARSITGKRATG